MTCRGPRILHTVGHSTRSSEELLNLLRLHDIELVIDVRRWPASRRYPQFKKEALASALANQAIDYIWRGDLGGFRKPRDESPNTAWRVGSFRAYADFMLSPEFDTSINEVETLALDKRSALMCAEAVPWRCHRQLLADAFLVRGWSVRHIVNDGCHEHQLPSFATVEGTRIVYPTPAK